MSTKKKTKQTIDYNKPALSAYDALQPQIRSGLEQYLQGALTNSPFFQEALAFLMPQANRLGQRGVQNVFQNARAAGFGGGAMPGFLAAGLGRAGRASSGLQSNAFWNAFSSANQGRLSALGQAQGFRPLQMGQTTVEKTSGLGTWLPQVASMALGAAMAPFTGGASLLGSMGGFFGGGAASPAQIAQGGAFSGLPGGLAPMTLPSLGVNTGSGVFWPGGR